MKSKLLSIDRFNLFSFYHRDHCNRKSEDLKIWLSSIFFSENIHNIDGEILLLTLPRILGYVFNPVSFFICFDKEHNLRAVIAEVNNTFGENHNYLIAHQNGEIINADDILVSKKIFHVSPFIESKSGYYQFRFNILSDKIAIFIDYFDQEDNKLLATSIKGKLVDLNDKNLLLSFIKYPFSTIKVIILIHFQAIKLWLKGVKYIKKPAHINNQISR
jgi:DUF1365 family protein